jgi:hypothetical protein
MSASAEVRVKRGSAWITVAPFAFACMTKRKAIGWFSAMFDPITRMESELARSHWGSVAAPRPKEAPKLGTDELCQTRAWFSIQTMPKPPEKSFLMR